MTAPAAPPAPLVSAAETRYCGRVTAPERWSSWQPRRGDILVCTPPKSGTTWTQSILAMLIHGPEALPAPVPVLSPWVDADLGVPADAVARALAAQPGRRVVKTHTPADGVPVWEGVHVVAVYRHPLDVFFSLRKHQANVAAPDPDEPMLRPLAEAFEYFVETPLELEDFDRDTLATLARHYGQTAMSGRVPGLTRMHYADMARDGRGAVARLARAAGINADEAALDAVARASSFASMRRNAAGFAPVAGTGYWASDARFFDSGTSGKWRGGALSEAQLARYSARLAALIPDPADRAWLEAGAAGRA